VLKENCSIASLIKRAALCPVYHLEKYCMNEGAHWVTGERTLPALLPMLTQLRLFVINSDWSALNWATQLSKDTQIAILKLFRIPSLQTIRLYSVTNLPAQVLFTNSVGLKELGLYACGFSDRAGLALPIPICVPAQGQRETLGSLEVGRYDESLFPSGITIKNGQLLVESLTHPESQLLISQLRELTLACDDEDGLHFASQVVRVASGSLKFITWDFTNCLIGTL
jgi:hypothetical protein